jgi:mono/diheme cytochrome c family protein
MRNGAAIACALALGACSQAAPPPLTGEALIARGDYLVNNIGGCNDCHTPMTPQGPDLSRALQGAPLGFAPTVEMPWAPVAPPIAGIPGHYTEEQFVTFLQTGVRPDGSRPLPPMPAFRLNEDDARAMTAYIQSLPAATE